jgi:hypothetical protein
MKGFIGIVITNLAIFMYIDGYHKIYSTVKYLCAKLATNI